MLLHWTAKDEESTTQGPTGLRAAVRCTRCGKPAPRRWAVPEAGVWWDDSGNVVPPPGTLPSPVKLCTLSDEKAAEVQQGLVALRVQIENRKKARPKTVKRDPKERRERHR